jgi:hypothetical protein
MTAARYVYEHQTHHLGQSLVDKLNRVKDIKQEEVDTKKKENLRILKNILQEAKIVCSKHNNKTDDIDRWSVKDITKILRTYRVKDDKPIPSKKKDVVDLYHNWKERPITKYNGKVVVDMTDEDVIVTTTTNEPQLPALPAVQEVVADQKVPIPVEAEASVLQLQPNNQSSSPVAL